MSGCTPRISCIVDGVVVNLAPALPFVRKVLCFDKVLCLKGA